MQTIRVSLAVVAVACFVPSSPCLGRSVIISEFMAINDASLADMDGEYPDWVELYNSADTEANLDGWFLTDTTDNLTRWRFPAVVLPPRSFLLVFASGKDNRDAASELHTDFRLSSRGEYLALVAPDGLTVVSEFGRPFPLQTVDATYGVAMESTRTDFVVANAAVRYLVPSDDSLGLTWTHVEFDDGTWSEGRTGIGYDRNRTPRYTDFLETNIQEQMDRVNPSAYFRIRFTVDDPSAVDSLVLRMLFNDGFIAYINGEAVVSRNAPAQPAWNSRSSGRQLGASFEEFNLSPVRGALRSGANVLAIQGFNTSASSADFIVLPELYSIRVDAVDSQSLRYYTRLTPGLPNPREGFPHIASPPEFSHPSGAYTDDPIVQLATETATGVIRYTLDGSLPTEESEVYSGPIVIENALVMTARTFAPGLLPSPPASRNYVLVHSSVADFSSNLPLVLMNTFGQGIGENWPRTPMHLVVIDTAEDGRSSVLGTPDYIGNAAFKYRGSSSLGFPKKNFAVELKDENFEDLNASVLGLAEDEDWILHGPYSDKSLIRNVLAYEWSNNIGRYAARTKLVEVFLNTRPGRVTMANYWGVYVLMEKIKRGADRVDIERLPRSTDSEPEITGGYIIKKDRLDPGDAGFRTSRQQLAFVYPKERNISPAQRSWLINYMNQFERALYGANFTDPEEGYRKYIDLDSFIDHHILNEFCKNIDGYRLSTFWFKRRGGKLEMGPIWDFNLSLRNANYLSGWLPTGWYYPQLSTNDYPYFPRLFQDPAFMDRYQERWGELRSAAFKESELMASVDKYAALLEEAQERNFQKWRILGTYVWPNPNPLARTWVEEIDMAQHGIKDWMRARLAWIDSQMIRPPSFSHNGGIVEEGLEVTISATDGMVVYTVDDSDPRTPGGDMAPTARIFDGPITITENTRIRARTKMEGIWSAERSALFVVDVPPLVITELMYNPAPPPEGSQYRERDFEFLELKNIGDEEFRLAGVEFTRGVTFDFSEGTVDALAAGERVLVVNNLEAFSSRYETEGLKIAGEFVGSLSNTGETVVLLGALGEPLHDFRYRDSWYVETDGGGYSLVVVDPLAARDAWTAASGWSPSSAVGGSPGREEPGEGGLQLPGDLGQNGRLDLSDVLALLGHIFRGTPNTLPCDGGRLDGEGNRALLDGNGDGRVNVSDGVHVLRYLWQAGPPPVLGEECVPIRGCPEVCP